MPANNPVLCLLPFFKKRHTSLNQAFTVLCFTILATSAYDGGNRTRIVSVALTAELSGA
jgi:hypothetical protein